MVACGGAVFLPGSSVGPKSPIAGLFGCQGAVSAPKAPFLEVGVCCMAFPDVLRCLPSVARGRHLNASGKAMQIVFLGKPAVHGAHSKSHPPWEGLVRSAGGKLHLVLHMGSRPIANKCHEGKVKRTLKRKVKVLEIAENEVSEATMSWRDCCTPPVSYTHLTLPTIYSV